MMVLHILLLWAQTLVQMVEIPAGSFWMGSEGAEAEYDEMPIHKVDITRPFRMGITEVTNAQYEQFAPEHKALRGRDGVSTEDEDAVVNVSWQDAVDFCEWLSVREGRNYRLPTEAEWEYACRAGTYTLYNTGDELPASMCRNQRVTRDYAPVSLKVGQTPPNAFGLCDMHGNVEEWCLDWYGAYSAEEQADPCGAQYGEFRVTRGGSHNTPVKYLRSSNRMAMIPEDKHSLTGFRVVESDWTPMMLGMGTNQSALGYAEDGRTGTNRSVSENDGSIMFVTSNHTTEDQDEAADGSVWMTGLHDNGEPNNAKSDIAEPGSQEPDIAGQTNEPFFIPPIPFVREPSQDSSVPFYSHNHQPSVTWCDNGDLLCAWYSTNEENGREMVVLFSRLKAGAEQWEEPELFFKVPDRNMTGTALFNDGKGTLYHINGVEAAGDWQNLIMILRTSTDNGYTWSAPRIIAPQHTKRHQVISGTLLLPNGWIVQACDAGPEGNDGTAIHVSRDGGLMWEDPWDGEALPDFNEGNTGSTIAGIHAGVVALDDGSLMALGRGINSGIIDDRGQRRMPMSVSHDMGKTWEYHATEFPPIDSGQRLVFMRLNEGPLLLVSFTDTPENERGMEFEDGHGQSYKGYGMFAAVSYDDGKTWPVKRLLTDGEERTLDGGGWTGTFTMDATHAEPKGYLTGTQSPDNTIHILSSRLHYRFNLKWLEQLPKF